MRFNISGKLSIVTLAQPQTLQDSDNGFVVSPPFSIN